MAYARRTHQRGPVRKRLSFSGPEVVLLSENRCYPAKYILEGDEFSIWGVVTHSLRSVGQVPGTRMKPESPEERRARTLADWHELINDQDALLADPDTHWSLLSNRANEAYSQGALTAEDLREMLDQADAAYASATG